MRRARRWFAAVIGTLLLAGCASSSDLGGETYTTEDALWTGIIFGAIVMGVVGAKILVESHE
jgi:outer membrane lipoprotein SlyB